MYWGAFTDWWAKLDPRRRIAVWALGICLVLGFSQALAPLDNTLLAFRNTYADRKASGQIVVVGIDDESIAAVGQWPWPRSRYAEMVDKLNEAGVRSIYFDILFGASGGKDDVRFAEAIRRSKVPVYIGANNAPDAITGKRAAQLPVAVLLDAAHLVVGSYEVDYAGRPKPMLIQQRIGDHQLPTMSASLAGQTLDGPSTDYVTDYGINAQSVPSVSASVILGNKLPEFIKGRDVIIGPTSVYTADLVIVSGRRRLPSTYLHVLGAETLKRGLPIDLGILPAMVLVASLLLKIAPWQRWGRRLVAQAAGASALLVIPYFLEQRLIITQIAPALLALTMFAILAGLSDLRQAMARRAVVNPDTGLPNFAALREQRVPDDEGMVVARISNYSTAVASLAPGKEVELIRQIIGRLSVGGIEQMYQGDDGLFAWRVDRPALAAIADHLEALNALFRTAFRVDGRSIDLGVIFGVDVAGMRAADTRLGNALVALEQAIEAGVRWKPFDEAQLADADWRLSLLGQLDAAIVRGEVWVAYQPKFDLRSGRVSGAEALVRWQHPERGTISPDQFIRAAEDNGRIDRLTSFVLEDAIARASSVADTRFGIAVNISTKLLEDGRIYSLVEALLNKYRLIPQRLTLEITESVALDPASLAPATIRELIELGVRISLDDYGTGHSNLEYLRSIPAHEVKVDRSFVQRLGTDAHERALVESVVHVARSLGLTVVVEGVEDEQILRAAQDLGCDYGQGFFIGRPGRWDAMFSRNGTQIYASE